MIHRTRTILTVLLAAVTIPVVAPGLAHAAPDCNSFTTYPLGDIGGYVRVPTIGWDTGAITCELGRGNFGDAVRVLQVSLRNCYFQNIADDRDFGPRTQAALRVAQRELRVPDDGRYGPQTRNAGFAFAIYPNTTTWTPIVGICQMKKG